MIKIVDYIFAAEADDKLIEDQEDLTQNEDMKKNEETVEKETCPICLDEIITDQEEKLILCCFSVFHKNCLDSWKLVKNTCPICRAVMYESDLMYIIH